MYHFFVPKLMAATVLVKTIVFDQFLIFIFRCVFVSIFRCVFAKQRFPKQSLRLKVLYTFDAEYSAHAILDSPQFSKIAKTQKSSRNGSPWLENQQNPDQISYFFEPELMAAAVLVKTIVFDQFLIFWFFDFFSIVWWWVSQVFGVESNKKTASFW